MARAISLASGSSHDFISSYRVSKVGASPLYPALTYDLYTLITHLSMMVFSAGVIPSRICSNIDMMNCDLSVTGLSSSIL